MPSIGLSFFILGLVVASVAADEATTSIMSTSAPGVSANLGSGNDSSLSTVAPPIDSDVNRTSSNPSVSNDTSSVNVTNTNSTDAPSTTKGYVTSTDDRVSPSTTPTMVTVKPQPPVPTEIPTGVEDKDKDTSPPKTSGDKTGIIILIVIILVAFVVVLVCFFARKRGRRYSVDFSSRPDEANIPLSTIDPEVPADAAPQNGLQTFASTETASEEPKEPEEPAEKPEVTEEPKAEADKSAVDPLSAESAALPPPPPPDSSDDKPKEDVAEESLPPPAAAAPVEPTVEEKTDDEGAVSNKTSVESLKETNENNSNNSDISQQGDTKSANLFWDVPLNSPL